MTAEQDFRRAARVADRGHVLVHGDVASGGTTGGLAANDAVRSLQPGA